MRSTIYHCPKCGGLVNIIASFEADKEYGDAIKIEVHCSKCQDVRYDTIDKMQYSFNTIVSKLGT